METTTMRHLRLAAESGDAAAQFNLGVLFDSREDDNGYAIEGNRTQAIKWLLAAAEQGLPRAQSRLAELYAGGPNASGNLVNACAWFLLATKSSRGIHRHQARSEYERISTRLTPAQNHQGETPSGTLEGAESSSNPTAWRRESAMRAWFVPPLVIPIFVVLIVMAFATYHAL